MDQISFLYLMAAILLAPFAFGDKDESQQFSSKPYYAVASDASEGHIRFPDDVDILPEDLDAAASVERIQGIKFYAVQNGNMPLIIYPVSNAGLTSPAVGVDQHSLESMSQPLATQPDASDQSDFEESMKNVAHGFIFPSSPATSHEEIFKQLLEAGSQGPAPEPYVIPTPQSKKKPEPETIITIPQLTHAYILEQPQLPVMTIFNQNQQPNEPIYIPQQIAIDEGQQQQQQEVNSHYSSDINVIPVEPQYVQVKPSHYHMVGPHLFKSEINGESQSDQEVHPTSPFREEPSKIPLHPPPPIKASTYGPPQTVPTGQSKRPYPPNHRPSGPSRSPSQYQNIKGSGMHSKGSPKNRPHHNSYRLHPGPHNHHGHHHHHHQYHQESPHHHYREPSHHHHHQHKEPHHSRPPPNHRPYEVHETKSPGPPNHSRPPPHTGTHKHPYNFHYHGHQKPSSGYGGSHPRPSSNSRPPSHHPDPYLTNKPPYRATSQKGGRPNGPPKTPPHGPPPNSNSIGSSHPGITKAIFHPTHSPDLTVNQNTGPIKDLHGYTPGRYEYDNEPSPTTHSTLSYSTVNHDSRRPVDASPSASISEPYVTSPPRPTYSDDEDEEANPTVEVYSPLSENFYGADPYQRIKQTFKPPVIVYKGVRPPVRVYQKPETGPPYHHLPASHLVRGSTSNHPGSHSYLPAIESTWANHNTASTPYYHQQRVRGSYSVASPSASSKPSDPPIQNVAEEIHLTTKAPFQYSPSSSSGSSSPADSLSSSSDDSSSWTPINAPAGAVPARAYHIPAPDLSRGVGNQPINHHSSYYGSANSRADDEDLVLTEQNSNNPSLTASTLSTNTQTSGTGSSQLRRENNSEEVVSAVVLVKHR